MSAKVKALVGRAFEHNASDIHLVEGGESYVRVNGAVIPAKGMVMTRADFDELMKDIASPRLIEDLEKNRSADFAWQPNEQMRLRIASFYERGHLRMVMRIIRIRISTVDELKLPEVVKTIAAFHRGLVLVTGITGSGKSTTLAAIINHINSERKACIITIEDPIEMVHPNLKSLVSQREVGRDVTSFRAGLVQALRQDPDIILIGEMRDQETISTGLRAAETGHFVLSTMHTTNATHTVERIFSEFPENEHALLREQLANNLRSTLTQRLAKTKDGKGRIAALEIMIVNDVIKKLILENRVEAIATIIRGRSDGMALFDQYLADLVRSDVISIEDGYEYAEDEFAFKRYVTGGGGGSGDAGGIIG